MLVSVLPAPVLRCLGCLGFSFFGSLFRISKRKGDVPGTVLCPGGLCGQVPPMYDGLRVFCGPVLLLLPLLLVPPCSLSRCKGKFRTVFRSTEDNRSSTVQPFVDFLRAAEASIFKSSEVLKTAGISQRSSSLLFLVFQRHVPSTSQNTAEVPPEKVIANVVPFQKAGSPSSNAFEDMGDTFTSHSVKTRWRYHQ